MGGLSFNLKTSEDFFNKLKEDYNDFKKDTSSSGLH
jgi:hypothetical protein